ncbi:MAG: acylneuraminate cytidylyltransferase family protein [Candidatus Andersenbacteria bacterium]
MNQSTQNPKRTPVEVAAIVPARGGQQSILYKNLQVLGGKTLVQWAIEVAFAAETVDAVFVSTEDAKIAAEAEKHGAIVIPRPVEYSQPTSSDAGWYNHAAKWMEEEHGWTPELLVNLRPTGPLRFPSDVDTIVNYMKESGADGVKSVIPAPLHPYKMWQFADEENKEVGQAGQLKPVFDNEYRQQKGPDQPRQQVQKMFPVFFQDAQIDVTRRQFVLRPECLANDNPWGPNMHGYVLDPRTSADLDTPEDFRRAEQIYRDIQAEREK